MRAHRITSLQVSYQSKTQCRNKTYTIIFASLSVSPKPNKRIDLTIIEHESFYRQLEMEKRTFNF